MSSLKVTYVKSSIGYSQRQKDTVRALGLRRLGQSVEVPDNLMIRGMIGKVKHLIQWELVAGSNGADNRGDTYETA